MVLFLNDVAGTEILVILLFILIFFGAESIPTLARTFGKVIRQINDAKQDIQGEIKKSSGSIKKELNLDGIFKETEQAIRQPLDQMTYDIEDSIKYEPKRTKMEMPAIEDQTSTIESNDDVVEIKEKAPENNPEA